MSKGLRNIPEPKRTQVILRRLKNKTNGNGYWAAVAALQKARLKVEKKAA